MSPLLTSGECGILDRDNDTILTPAQGLPGPYYRVGGGPYTTTCLRLPATVLTALRAAAYRQHKNVSWVVEERLQAALDAGLLPPVPVTLQPKARQRGGTYAAATVRLSTALLAAVRAASGGRSLAAVVTAVLTAQDTTQP